MLRPRDPYRRQNGVERASVHQAAEEAIADLYVIVEFFRRKHHCRQQKIPSVFFSQFNVENLQATLFAGTCRCRTR
jgi:hypothetical protein